jgi:putative salt-induced outer membrane protein YdiY
MKSTQASLVTRCVIVLILSVAGVCRADQVTLDNGDRLTGKVKKLADGKVVINTDYAGDVKIDTKHIVSLETDSEMTVVLDDETRLYGRLSGNGQTLGVSDGGATVDMAHVTALEPGHLTGQEWKFSGRFSLGASESNGNTNTRNLNWDGEGVARHGKNRYTLGGRGKYASSNDGETDNNTVLYGQYDRFLSKKWYAYANASFQNDRFSDIRLRTTLSAGLGYQWLATKRTNLALEAGPTYVYTDYYTQATEQNPALRLVSRFDHWLWQDAVQFFNTNEFYPSLSDYDNSFLRSQIGFRFPLVDHFIATAQLNLDWNGNPPPGKVKLDTTTILSVGYTW